MDGISTIILLQRRRDQGRQAAGDADKPNPFFTGAENTLRYLRVLKECNLNNAEIERALSLPR